MVCVGSSERCGFRVGFCVVAAFGQSKAALLDLGDILQAIFVVGPDAEIKRGIDAERVQMGDFGFQ